MWTDRNRKDLSGATTGGDACIDVSEDTTESWNHVTMRLLDVPMFIFIYLFTYLRIQEAYDKSSDKQYGDAVTHANHAFSQGMKPR